MELVILNDGNGPFKGKVSIYLFCRMLCHLIQWNIMQNIIVAVQLSSSSFLRRYNRDFYMYTIYKLSSGFNIIRELVLP